MGDISRKLAQMTLFSACPTLKELVREKLHNNILDFTMSS